MATATETVIGNVVQVAGPAVDCQFPEGQIPRGLHRHPHHQRRLRRSRRPSTSSAKRSSTSAKAASAPSRMQPTEGLVRGMKAISLGGTRSTCRWASETLGRVLNVIGQPVDKMGPVNAKQRYPDSSPRAVVRRSVDAPRNVRDRHQGHRSARALSARRQDRPVRRRGRRQDRHHHGADQQHRHEARRRFGVRRRGRAHPRRQRSVARNAGRRRHRSARLHQVESARWSTAR